MWLGMTWVPAAPGASATLLLAPETAGTEVPQAPAALPQFSPLCPSSCSQATPLGNPFKFLNAERSLFPCGGASHLCSRAMGCSCPGTPTCVPVEKSHLLPRARWARRAGKGCSKDQGAAGFPLAFTRCGRAQSACRLCPLYTGPGLLEGSSSTRLDGRQRWVPKTPLQRNAA